MCVGKSLSCSTTNLHSQTILTLSSKVIRGQSLKVLKSLLFNIFQTFLLSRPSTVQIKQAVRLKEEVLYFNTFRHKHTILTLRSEIIHRQS